MRDQSTTEQPRIVPLAPERRPPWWRRNLKWLAPVVAAVLLLATVAVVFSFWRTDQVAVRPGSVLEVPSNVTISGAEAYPPQSEISLVTVLVSQRLNIWQRIFVEFESGVDLEPERTFTGDGTRDELRQRNRERMQTSQQVAAIVALEHLGYEIPSLTSGVIVVETRSDTPASEVLEVDDVIVGIEGVVVNGLSDLAEFLAFRSPGDVVTLEVERGEVDPAISVMVELVESEDEPGRALIGVGAQEQFADPELPVEVDIDSGAIGGPSAGLALTLGIVDLLTPGELTGGLKVAATGTIAVDGSVGAIGEVDQKTIAAERAGVDLLLVPVENLGEALNHVSGDMKVVGVESFEDAMSALAQA